jgi:hypothetical protein
LGSQTLAEALAQPGSTLAAGQEALGDGVEHPTMPVTGTGVAAGPLLGSSSGQDALCPPER